MTDERKAFYWLSISGLSVKKQNELLAAYGNPLKIFNSIEDQKIKDFAGSSYAVMKRYADETFLTGRLTELTRKGIKVLVRSMSGYPERLAQTEVVPPLVLYYRGNVKLLDSQCIAVVGTRKSDEYGKEATKHIVAKLAAKLTIVTGHATGIDNYAARFALEAGGSVIIFAACGLETLTLPDFINKADDSRKLIITEYEPDTASNKFTFPVRNRLISGISNGVAVIQAPEKSGALITVDFAANQGRNVYAVPGSIVSKRCKGSNDLLLNGATLLTDAQVIFDDMNIQYNEDAPTEEIMLDGDEKEVYDFLHTGRKHVDEIMQHMKKPPHELFSLLSSMELDGKIKKKISNYYEI